jgi:AraC-like DNA-binding protein
MNETDSQRFAQGPPALEGSIVHGIVLVDEVTRPTANLFQSTSPPGHLLHLVLAGEVEQEVSGQIQHLKPGNAVWYFENEPVRGKILQAPWTFLTVNFLAPRLPPPAYDHRVWTAGRKSAELFRLLLAAWRASAPPVTRHLQTFARLLDLLVEVLPQPSPEHRSDLPTQPWWEIEARLREDLSQPIDLARLQSMSKRSQRSIVRACEAATGASPMKRVKELRLSYARGLVLYSQMSMTEIAVRVGYGRVQELSRDYHRRFGKTPRTDRRDGPDYRRLESPRK